MKYRKYSQTDSADNFTGFLTPTKRVEIYSSTFFEQGYEPLPTWKLPNIFKREGMAENYPVVETLFLSSLQKIGLGNLGIGQTAHTPNYKADLQMGMYYWLKERGEGVN